jgi:hypothetical protein
MRKHRNITRKRHMRSRKNKKRLRGGNSPLKVAILFSGRINGYESVLSKLQEIKNRYNPTYYCSLNEPEYNEYIDKFCKLFDISRDRINIESTPYPDFLNDVKGYGDNKQKHTYSMFYHENKAFSLIEKDITENKKQFHCVLYFRADMDSPDILNLQVPNPDTIYIPNGHNYQDNTGINDRAAYGTYESMKKYCNVIHTLKSAENMNNINAEIILRRYLESQSIKIVRFDYTTCLSEARSPDWNRFSLGACS